MRESFLRQLYKLFPFDLKGDCAVPPPQQEIKLSCVINFYGRLDLLAGILHSLAQQDFPREAFEVVLVEDRGGTGAGRELTYRFSDRLQIRYFPLDKNYGHMGYSRNYALSLSRGEVVLFLDDDTVILQRNFFDVLVEKFALNSEIDAVVPHGMASYVLLDGKYAYHEPYFMTSRCTAYRRSVLADLGGFINHFIGQEDVEFVARFNMAMKKSCNVQTLEFFHPPLIVGNLRKPEAVGFSFYKLKNRYPAIIWFLLIINCARHAPLYLIPARRYREMGRFGIGFVRGILKSMLKKAGFQYS